MSFLKIGKIALATLSLITLFMIVYLALNLDRVVLVSEAERLSPQSEVERSEAIALDNKVEQESFQNRDNALSEAETEAISLDEFEDELLAKKEEVENLFRELKEEQDDQKNQSALILEPNNKLNVTPRSFRAFSETALSKQKIVPFQNNGTSNKIAFIFLEDGDSDVSFDDLSRLPFPFAIGVDTTNEGAQERIENYRSLGLEVYLQLNNDDVYISDNPLLYYENLMSEFSGASGVVETEDLNIQFSPEIVQESFSQYFYQSGHGVILYPNGFNSFEKTLRRQGVRAISIFRDLRDPFATQAAIRRSFDRIALQINDSRQFIVSMYLYNETISALRLWALQDKSADIAIVPASEQFRSLH